MRLSVLASRIDAPGLLKQGFLGAWRDWPTLAAGGVSTASFAPVAAEASMLGCNANHFEREK